MQYGVFLFTLSDPVKICRGESAFPQTHGLTPKIGLIYNVTHEKPPDAQVNIRLFLEA